MDSDVKPPEDKTETFKTPEEVAANEKPDQPAAAGGAEDATLDSNSPMSSKSKSKWHKLDTLNWPPGKKEWIIFAVILLLLAGGIFWWLHSKKPETLKPIPKLTGQKTVPSTLTGLPVDPSVNKRTVTGVMIENSVFARPQSGLGQAGVVFEAIAEAGITRFLALYQDTAPANVGPIRSARPYYIRWNLAFNAGYAHVGGSPEALADINRWHVRDLNQFYNGDSYHRIASRAAPHNVYTSIAILNKLEVQKGYKTSHFTGFARNKKAFRPKNQPITARSINFAISSADYHVHYDFDAKTDSYLRSEGGAPHIDANNNKRIRPVVVIAMVMHYNLERDGYHSNYGAIGSGRAFIFQNGQVMKAIWVKKDNTSQLTFKDSKGKTIRLNPGQTWLSAVSGENQVTYSAK
jgi:hypothetical protein